MHRDVIAAVICITVVSQTTASHAADSAAAALIDQKGEKIGTVTLSPLAAGGVHLVAVATGLVPGIHAFHIHETGQCDPDTEFKSAGGHYNPTDAGHGWQNAEGPHAGDLPNTHIHENGKLAMEQFVTTVSLDEDDPATLFDEDGSAIVIHRGADDYMTEPAGAAGDRIACAVIKPR